MRTEMGSNFGVAQAENPKGTPPQNVQINLIMGQLATKMCSCSHCSNCLAQPTGPSGYGRGGKGKQVGSTTSFAEKPASSGSFIRLQERRGEEQGHSIWSVERPATFGSPLLKLFPSQQAIIQTMYLRISAWVCYIPPPSQTVFPFVAHFLNHKPEDRGYLITDLSKMLGVPFFLS